MKPYSEHVALARAGFTLVELLVVVAMVGLLATMLAPTMARTKPNSASFQCQNNLRQLVFAWKMYADDNHGNLVYNGEGAGYSAGTAAWVGGWMDYSASTDNTNTGLLIDHDKYPYCAFLGPYIKTPLAFKCPADKSTALMADGPQPRVRSVSMNSRGSESSFCQSSIERSHLSLASSPAAGQPACTPSAPEPAFCL